jgi:hypothetical protein
MGTSHFNALLRLLVAQSRFASPASQMKSNQVKSSQVKSNISNFVSCCFQKMWLIIAQRGHCQTPMQIKVAL